MGLHSISLFTGIGGLDIGVSNALARFGVSMRTICYVEGEAFPICHLVKKIEACEMDAAPIWTDVTSFDCNPWVGKVDCLVAGFPCTDISDAGNKIGITGEKSGLWSEVVRIARELRPQFLFLENVAAITLRGLDRVLKDISDLGMDVLWTIVSAEEVGAPQRRKRWFALAYVNDQRLQRVKDGLRTAKHSETAMAEVARNSCAATLEHPDELRHLSKSSHEMQTQNAHHAIARMGQHHWPPGPNDIEGWRAFSAHGLLVEPAIPRTPTGISCRMDRTRALGNTVIPQQAEFAFVGLIKKMLELKNEQQ